MPASLVRLGVTASLDAAISKSVHEASRTLLGRRFGLKLNKRHSKRPVGSKTLEARTSCGVFSAPPGAFVHFAQPRKSGNLNLITSEDYPRFVEGRSIVRYEKFSFHPCPLGHNSANVNIRTFQKNEFLNLFHS